MSSLGGNAKLRHTSQSEGSSGIEREPVWSRTDQSVRKLRCSSSRIATNSGFQKVLRLHHETRPNDQTERLAFSLIYYLVTIQTIISKDFEK